MYHGDIAKALSDAGKVLQVKGNIFPVTTDNAHLVATLENGEKIVGETNIDIPKHDPNLKIHTIALTNTASIYEEAKKALLTADLIVLGPGDLYTSILPNLLVEEVPRVIKQSNARVMYICNLMTKKGESQGYSASTFISEIERYLQQEVDFVVCNNKTPGEKETYLSEGSNPVVIDIENLKNKRIVCEDMLSEGDVVRHDPYKLAQVVMYYA